MNHYILIQNARIVQTAQKRIVDADLLLKVAPDGGSATVAAIEPRIPKDSVNGTVKLLNARGNLITPCFADLSVTLREPGSMYKQSIEKTAEAARAGGYDTILSFFEPSDTFSLQEVLSYWQALPKRKDVEMAFTAYAFLKDGSLVDPDAVFAQPAVALTNRYVSSDNRAILQAAMAASALRDRTFVLYPRVASLAREGVVNRHVAPSLRVKGLSPIVEEIAVAESLMICEDVGCRLHIAGVSTAKSVKLVRDAKKAGIAVTADTAPPYFTFHDGEVFFRGKEAKLFPPLREEADRMAVIEGIADGTIDAIASHHTPHAARDYQRKTLTDAPFGGVGLETVFAASVEALLSRGYISTLRLVDLVSTAPRRILQGMGVVTDADPIAVGKTPNFNLVSLDKKFPVTEALFCSRAHNSPFMGLTLQGMPEHTFRRGIEVPLT
ncbi:MAG: hypothetical protein IJW46_05555 [Clostridia bacterium]|nr:hypothetical protein [Clostridia bacterium]